MSSFSAPISQARWSMRPAYIGKGVQEGNMEEAMLHFFYEGIDPLIKKTGYKWLDQEKVIARKFVQLCYMIDTTKYMDNWLLNGPEIQHRNLKEDREVFDFLIDTFVFNDFLEKWNHYPEVVGTPFDYLLKDFCYTWVDVTSGYPGSMTQKILEADEEEEEEEAMGAVEVLSRRNWSLY